MAKHNWKAVLKRAQDKAPRAAEPGEIIVHPGQQLLADTTHEWVGYTKQMHCIATKRSHISDGQHKQQGGLFDD